MQQERLRVQLKAQRMRNDTIAVITTPLGEGGIGVIQVSGPDALETVGRVFRGKKGGEDFCGASSGELFYGIVMAAGGAASTPIDEAIVCVWRSEDSLTGEDLVEINCHGGPRAVRNTLDTVIEAGAREAGWAEFLGRGLRNNRMDCVQVEAQEALTRAKTRLSARVFLVQYQRTLSQRISQLEADIDAIADNVHTGGLPHKDVLNKLALLLEGLDELMDSSVFGLALSSPQRVSIAGAPNVGKSTLFNTLLKEERVIVHHLPGTTRDYISEYLSVRGIPFELVDSAGLRETHDHVEKKGVERAHEVHKHADKVILMLDGSRDLCDKEWMSMSIRNLGLDPDKKQVIPVVNKIDLGVALDTARLEAVFGGPVCHISALKGLGLESLEKLLVREFQPYIDYYETNCGPKPVVFTERQQLLLSQARDVAGEALGTFTHTRALDVETLGLVRDKLREFRHGPGHNVSKETLQKVVHTTEVKD